MAISTPGIRAQAPPITPPAPALCSKPRLFQSLGLKPRRTIRVALWSGEEEGLLGSLAYVAQHFGTAENPKPEWYKLDARISTSLPERGRPARRGIFGPPAAADVLRPVLAHFTDWGVFGASVTNTRATNGTDSTSLNNAGLPGVGFTQDPIEYNTLTHHSSLDTHERIIPDDVEKAAAVAAACVWHVVNRDEMVPCFSEEQTPPYSSGIESTSSSSTELRTREARKLPVLSSRIAGLRHERRVLPV